MIMGIVAGLVGAFSQAWSYFFSRHFVTASGQGTRHLLVIGHIWMALFSLALMPFIFRQPVDGWASVWLPLLGAAGGYFLGQIGMLWTMKRMPASRVAPLLGAKLLFLAVLGVTLFGKVLTGWQWAAVGIAAVAALGLNWAGERIPLRGILGLVWTCTGYATSDLSIPHLIAAFGQMGETRVALLAVVTSYIACGLVVLPWVVKLRLTSGSMWLKGLPFAATWYLAMCFLFISIGLVGVVLAVILQSSRGPMSIGLGRLVGRSRHTHLEQTLPGHLLLRQLAAALLMCVAIGLYVWQGSAVSSAAAPAPAPATPPQTTPARP